MVYRVAIQLDKHVFGNVEGLARIHDRAVMAVARYCVELQFGTEKQKKMAKRVLEQLIPETKIEPISS